MFLLKNVPYNFGPFTYKNKLAVLKYRTIWLVSFLFLYGIIYVYQKFYIPCQHILSPINSYSCEPMKTSQYGSYAVLGKSIIPLSEVEPDQTPHLIFKLEGYKASIRKINLSVNRAFSRLIELVREMETIEDVKLFSIYSGSFYQEGTPSGYIDDDGHYEDGRISFYLGGSFHQVHESDVVKFATNGANTGGHISPFIVSSPGILAHLSHDFDYPNFDFAVEKFVVEDFNCYSCQTRGDHGLDKLCSALYNSNCTSSVTESTLNDFSLIIQGQTIEHEEFNVTKTFKPTFNSRIVSGNDGNILKVVSSIGVVLMGEVVPSLIFESHPLGLISINSFVNGVFIDFSTGTLSEFVFNNLDYDPRGNKYYHQYELYLGPFICPSCIEEITIHLTTLSVSLTLASFVVGSLMFLRQKMLNQDDDLIRFEIAKMAELSLTNTAKQTL